MTDDTTATAATETGPANGKTDAKPKPAPHRRTTESEADPVTVKVTEPCEDCDEPGRGAFGLGLLLCAVAGGLLYIGMDLITGGGLTRKLAGAREDEE